MITRINFLEKKKMEITYGTLAAGIGSAFVVCLLLYGFLALNSFRTKKMIQSLEVDIAQLQKQREALINQQTVIQGGAPYVAIQQALEKNPPWAAIMGSVIESLPSRVWLASLKSAFKGSDPSKREIIMNGQAKGAQVLALFLANLGKSSYFEKVTLSTSAEESAGLFQFTIACDIGNNPWSLKPSPNQESKF